MTERVQHLSWAYDVPYLVTWTETGTDTLTAKIERADTEFSGTWADEPKTITLPRFLVEDLGHQDAIQQMLIQLAPVAPGAADPALAA
jgi:hypothetical protein